MNEHIEFFSAAGLIGKIRQPEKAGPIPVTLLLHGWTGDENSMWVFASHLPVNHLVIAPRAPYLSTHAERGGYSWTERRSGEWPWLDDFLPSTNQMKQLLVELARSYEGDFSRIDIAGFSQGAALAYAFALLNPDRVRRVAGLAGFLPERCEDKIQEEPLAGIPLFMAHGSRDDIVPVSKAQRAAEMLAQAGAHVSFCESDVGHRLGSDCFKAFQQFMLH
jgi:phospholipase/carboxylesterase